MHIQGCITLWSIISGVIFCNALQDGMWTYYKHNWILFKLILLSRGHLLMISRHFIAKYVASVLCNRQAKERPPVIYIIVRQPPQMVQIHCVLDLQHLCHAQGYMIVLLCRPHLYIITKYVAPIQGGRQEREMPHTVHCHSPPNSSNASDVLCICVPTSLPWTWYSDGVVVSRQPCLPCINYLTMACTH